MYNSPRTKLAKPAVDEADSTIELTYEVTDFSNPKKFGRKPSINNSNESERVAELGWGNDAWLV